MVFVGARMVPSVLGALGCGVQFGIVRMAISQITSADFVGALFFMNSGTHLVFVLYFLASGLAVDSWRGIPALITQSFANCRSAQPRRGGLVWPADREHSQSSCSPFVRFSCPRALPPAESFDSTACLARIAPLNRLPGCICFPHLGPSDSQRIVPPLLAIPGFTQFGVPCGSST